MVHNSWCVSGKQGSQDNLQEELSIVGLRNIRFVDDELQDVGHLVLSLKWEAKHS